MISIRPATITDRDGMLGIARRLPAWFNAEGLAQMSLDFEQHGTLVAMDEGVVVGFVTYAPSPHTPEPDLVETTWLGVDPDWRRNGLGRLLLDALEERCRRESTRVIQVSTLADTVDYAPYAETRAFYRAIGFADFRVDPDHYGPGDDRLLLRKTVPVRP